MTIKPFIHNLINNSTLESKKFTIEFDSSCSLNTALGIIHDRLFDKENENDVCDYDYLFFDGKLQQMDDGTSPKLWNEQTQRQKLYTKDTWWSNSCCYKQM